MRIPILLDFLVLEDFQHMPGNGFAFAIGVSRQVQGVRPLDGAGDVAHGDGIAGLIGDEAHLAGAVFEDKDIGGKSLCDGFLGNENRFGEFVATISLGNVTEIRAFLLLILAHGVAGVAGRMFYKWRIRSKLNHLMELEKIKNEENKGVVVDKK